MDVSIQKGNEAKVLVKTDDNLREIVETLTEGSELVVSARESYRTSLGIKVEVITPAIRAVVLTGSGMIAVEDVSGDDFEAVLSGSGQVNARGRVRNVTAELSGSGTLDLSDLECQSASVMLAGSGLATVNASDALNATVTGSGNVSYLGFPQVKLSISGSGAVSPLE
jgi:hypothetical protein